MSLQKHIGTKYITGMSQSDIINSMKEQEICRSCGMCCDGTLFSRARLEAGEKGNLPIKIEERYHRNNESEFFKLPCPYFSKECTIYSQKKKAN